MKELNLIPSLVRDGVEVKGKIPAGFAKDLPGAAELRLVHSRPGKTVPVDEAVILSVAAQLWTRARLRGKPSFMRYLHKWVSVDSARAERIWEVACRRRRESVAIFDQFARELGDLWPEG